jgi:hypothetical protein
MAEPPAGFEEIVAGTKTIAGVPHRMLAFGQRPAIKWALLDALAQIP